jgi:hypothetical protein
MVITIRRQSPAKDAFLYLMSNETCVDKETNALGYSHRILFYGVKKLIKNPNVGRSSPQILLTRVRGRKLRGLVHIMRGLCVTLTSEVFFYSLQDSCPHNKRSNFAGIRNRCSSDSTDISVTSDKMKLHRYTYHTHVQRNSTALKPADL